MGRMMILHPATYRKSPEGMTYDFGRLELRCPCARLSARLSTLALLVFSH